MCYNSNLDLVNINAYTKFGEILPICSEDISGNENLTEGRRDGMTDNPNPPLHLIRFCMIYIKQQAGMIGEQQKLKQDHAKAHSRQSVFPRPQKAIKAQIKLQVSLNSVVL